MNQVTQNNVEKKLSSMAGFLVIGDAANIKGILNKIFLTPPTEPVRLTSV